MAPILLANYLEDFFSWASLGLCVLLTISPYFLAMMNALISVSILLVRLIHVHWSDRIITADKRKALNCIIIVFTFGVSFSLTAGVFYYKDQFKLYRNCIGDPLVGSNFFDLPILHPLPLATTTVFLARSFSVPIGYIFIFFFTEKTTRKAPGLSENSRKKRRIQNAVNAKFNFYVWMCEMSSYAVHLFKGTFSARIYLVLSFGVSPILYLLGMEETRIHLQKMF